MNWSDIPWIEKRSLATHCKENRKTRRRRRKDHREIVFYFYPKGTSIYMQHGENLPKLTPQS